MLERLFGKSKRRERRRSGRKNLAQDLEHSLPEAFLALNLESQAYLDIVCGGKIENLAAEFAKLRRRRSIEIPADSPSGSKIGGRRGARYRQLIASKSRSGLFLEQSAVLISTFQEFCPFDVEKGCFGEAFASMFSLT